MPPFVAAHEVLTEIPSTMTWFESLLRKGIAQLASSGAPVWAVVLITGAIVIVRIVGPAMVQHGRPSPGDRDAAFDLLWFRGAAVPKGTRVRGRAISHARPVPIRERRPRRRVRRLHGLSPLGRRLLAIYSADPATPPDLSGVRGRQTLLGHVLDTSLRARRLAPTFGIDEWLAEVVVFAHDVGKVEVFRPSRRPGEWHRSGELHSRASARLLWRLPEFHALPSDVGEAIRMVAKYHHDPENIPLDLRSDEGGSPTLTERLLDLLRLADQAATVDAKATVEPSIRPVIESALPEAIRAALAKHNVNQHRADEHYQGFLFEDGALVLPEAEFRERVVDELRMAHPDLAVELGSAERRRRGTTHKALELIATAIRDVGAIVEAPAGFTEPSLLWNVRVGRKTWNACLLLDLRQLTACGWVDAAQVATWGQAPFDREIRGPTRLGAPKAADENEAIRASGEPEEVESPGEAPEGPVTRPPEDPPVENARPETDEPSLTGESAPPLRPSPPPPRLSLIVPVSADAQRIIRARSAALGIAPEVHAQNLLVRAVAANAARTLKRPGLRNRLRSVPLAETSGHVTDDEITALVQALASAEKLSPSAWMVRALDQALGVRR